VGGGRQLRAPGGAEPVAPARRVKVPQPAAPTGARSSVSEWVGQVHLQELEGPGGAAGEAGAASTPPRPAKGAAARAAGRVEAGEAGEAARQGGAARREGSGASLDERARSPRSEPPSPARRSESEPLPPRTLLRSGDAGAGSARGSGSGGSSAYIAVKALNASMHEAGGADARLAASRGSRPAAAAPRGRPASAAVEESREAQGPREPRGDTRYGACPRSSPPRGLPSPGRSPAPQGREPERLLRPPHPPLPFLLRVPYRCAAAVSVSDFTRVEQPRAGALPGPWPQASPPGHPAAAPAALSPPLAPRLGMLCRAAPRHATPCDARPRCAHRPAPGAGFLRSAATLAGPASVGTWATRPGAARGGRAARPRSAPLAR
jgi:hypothetical protein